MSAGLLASPLVILITKVTKKGLGKNDLGGEAQAMAAKKLFGILVFRAFIRPKNVRPAARTNDFSVFDAVNHLQDEDRSQASTSDD